MKLLPRRNPRNKCFLFYLHWYEYYSLVVTNNLVVLFIHNCCIKYINYFDSNKIINSKKKKKKKSDTLKLTNNKKTDPNQCNKGLRNESALVSPLYILYILYFSLFQNK